MRFLLSHFVVAFVAVLMLVITMDVFAIDYYVDGQHGDDSNSGLTADNAWKTITHALEAAAATEENPAIINVAAGIYSASTNGESFPLQLKSNVGLRGIGPRDTALDAERNASRLIMCDSAHGLSLEGLTLMGVYPPPSQAPMDPEARATAVVLNASSITLRNCIIRDNVCAKTEDAPAIRANGSELNVVSSELLSNEVGPSFGPGGTRSPGAIRCESSSLGISSSVFAGNTPGAIIALDCDVSVQSSRFCDNSAGVVLESYGGALRVASSSFSDNQSQSIVKCGGDLRLASSLFTGNSRTLIESWLSDGWIADCLFLDNTLRPSSREQRSYVISVDDGSCLLNRCVISGNTIQADEMISLSDNTDPAVRDLRVVLRNCILSDNIARARALIWLGSYSQGPVRAASASVPFLQIEGCTIKGNTTERLYESSRTSLLYTSRYTFVIDTAFHFNHADFFLNHGSADHDIHISHSCLESEMDGEGNFVADPLFVSGPLGDYYLSSVEAGQDADSPCIDAGSTSASIAGVANMTTRTDGAFDTGIVDIGYHYPATPPTIGCTVSNGAEPTADPPQFGPGDTLSASITLANGGLPVWVDLYAGFILPDGTIFCITPDGLTADLTAYSSALLLPQGLEPIALEVLQTQLPDGLPEGDYIFAAALSLTGHFRHIGNIAMSSFRFM